MIPFPNKKYSIIYADPPWKINSSSNFNTKNNKKPRKPIPYPMMRIEDIEALPVKDLAENDSHLYLWVINKYIPEAYKIARSWGFKPITLITWCKKPRGLGMGSAYVQSSEHLLYCRRGRLTPKKRVDSSWFLVKRQNKHSKKPQFFRDLIVEVSGDLPRIELFARDQIAGWDCWGNEVPVSE